MVCVCLCVYVRLGERECVFKNVQNVLFTSFPLNQEVTSGKQDVIRADVNYLN